MPLYKERWVHPAALTRIAERGLAVPPTHCIVGLAVLTCKYIADHARNLLHDHIAFGILKHGPLVPLCSTFCSRCACVLLGFACCTRSAGIPHDSCLIRLVCILT